MSALFISLSACILHLGDVFVMQLDRFSSQHGGRVRSNCILLCFAWLLGILAGVCWAGTVQNISTLMNVAAAQHVSIVALIAVTVLPLLFSAFAVYIRLPQFLFPIAFMDAVWIGFFLLAVVTSFGSAGWLIGGLMAFSDIMLRIPLFLFWFRHIDKPAIALEQDFIYCLLFAVVICILDQHFIAPFLFTLLH